MASHTHKYIRIKVGKNKRSIYKCALPGCVHHVREPQLMVGRLSLCNRCNDPFIIDQYSVSKDVAKPHCRACTKSEKQEAINEIAAMFKE